MARTDTLGHFLTDVADAIRTKTGSSDTIQASDFDTEIENIPSGGSSPTTIDELNEAIDELMSSYNNYLDTIKNNYTPYYNEAITLYAPYETHKNYIIRHKSNENYQIMWVPNYIYLVSAWLIEATAFDFCMCDYTNILSSVTNYKMHEVEYRKMNSIYYNKVANNQNETYKRENANSPIKLYISADYTTLNDCLDAIQSSQTTYTEGQFVDYGSTWGCKKISECYTNMVLLKHSGASTGGNDEFLYINRLSLSETINTINQ